MRPTEKRHQRSHQPDQRAAAPTTQNNWFAAPNGHCPRLKGHGLVFDGPVPEAETRW